MNVLLGVCQLTDTLVCLYALSDTLGIADSVHHLICMRVLCDCVGNSSYALGFVVVIA